MKKKCFSLIVLMFALFFVNFDEVNAIISLEDYNPVIVSDSTTQNKVNIISSNGDVRYVSGDESYLTIDDNGVITPLKDGLTYVDVFDDNSNERIYIFINVNSTIENEIDNIISGNMKDFDLPFPKGVLEKTDYSDYVIDYIYGEFYKLVNFRTDNGYYYLSDVGIDNYEYVTFRVNKAIEVEDESNNVINMVTYENKNEYRVKANFREFNQSDYDLVNKVIKNIKPVYKSYLNSSFNEMIESGANDNMELLINASDLEKDINNKDITYFLDARMGNDDLEQATIGGFLQLKYNDTIYGVVDTKFERTIKIPPVKDNENIIDVIKKFFEDNFISSDEEVEIKKIDDPEEDLYQAIIRKKDSSSILIGMIGNFFIPSVKADSNDVRVVTFKVEQSKDVLVSNNISDSTVVPNTYDNILVFIVIAVVGVVSLIFMIKKFKNIKD